MTKKILFFAQLLSHYITCFSIHEHFTAYAKINIISSFNLVVHILKPFAMMILRNPFETQNVKNKENFMNK